VLPADVFDTIDLTSFVYNGIGAGDDWEFRLDSALPFCVHGQACEADTGNSMSEASAALYRAGITRDCNDRAVRAINGRKGRYRNARVDFLTEYVPELNITRGE
jgi:hypothetical protein